MNIDEFFQHETMRSDAYRGLAMSYDHPVEGLGDILKKLESKLAALASDAITPLIMACSTLHDESALEDIQVEHARLFVGPYSLPSPPYGSVYMEGERMVMGPSTMDALERYRAAGLKLSQRFKDAPDHISAELEFMYFLILKEIDSLQKEDIPEARNWILQQRDFLRDHIGFWLPRFEHTVKQHSKLDFYSHLAEVTRIFILEDLQVLDQSGVPEFAINCK